MSFLGHYNPANYGWSADASQMVPYSYSGISFPSGAHRLAVPVFDDILTKLVAAGLHIPDGPVMQAGNWGYEPRNVRGSVSLSFHAFGLAVDVDAPHNGMSTAVAPATTFPIVATRKIVAADLSEWGYDWSGRKDPMHIEIHMTPDECRAFHGAKVSGLVPGGHAVIHLGSTGKEVATVQRRLNLKPSVHPAFGPATEAGVKMYQARHKVTADGIVGAKTWSLFLSARVLPGERIIKVGCTGPDVSWWQRRMNLKPNALPAFGTVTRDVTMAWQKKVGLKPDGIVGLQTWAKAGANG